MFFFLENRYWLYGEKFEGKLGCRSKELPREERPKGWFPRKCAIEVMNSVCENHPSHQEQSDSEEPIPSCMPSTDQSDLKKDQ